MIDRSSSIDKPLEKIKGNSPLAIWQLLALMWFSCIRKLIEDAQRSSTDLFTKFFLQFSDDSGPGNKTYDSTGYIAGCHNIFH